MKLTRTLRFNPFFFGLAPFVNVIFLVVIFFTLSSRFVLQPGLAISLPYSSLTLAPLRNPQIVSITSGPSPMIYFRDQPVALADLPKTLANFPTKDRTIIIRADRTTAYELVIAVTNHVLQSGFTPVLATAPEKK